MFYKWCTSLYTVYLWYGAPCRWWHGISSSMMAARHWHLKANCSQYLSRMNQSIFSQHTKRFDYHGDFATSFMKGQGVDHLCDHNAATIQYSPPMWCTLTNQVAWLYFRRDNLETSIWEKTCIALVLSMRKNCGPQDFSIKWSWKSIWKFQNN